MTKFKIGDQVKLTAEAKAAKIFSPAKHGITGVVTHVQSSGDWQGVDSDIGACIDAAWLELAPRRIDPTKKYRTRDGHGVTIITVNGPDPECPVVVHIPDGKKHRRYQVRCADGAIAPPYFGVVRESPGDLIEIPPTPAEHDGWILLRSNAHGQIVADPMVLRERDRLPVTPANAVARIRVKFREGEGL